MISDDIGSNSFFVCIIVCYYSRLLKNTFTNPGKASFSSIVPSGLVCFMYFGTAYTADIQKTNCLLHASMTIQFIFCISPVNSNIFVVTYSDKIQL
jgi:hypothetical protein